MINYNLLQEWFDLRPSEVEEIKKSKILESFGVTTELIKNAINYNPYRYELGDFDDIKDLINIILSMVMQLLVKDVISLLNPESDWSVHGGYDKQDGFWLECTDIDWKEQSITKEYFKKKLDFIIGSKLNNYWVF